MPKARVGYARQMARKVLKNSGQSSPPIDVRAVAAASSLHIRELSLPNRRWSGQLYRSEQAIAVNAAHHEHRKRFTIAHELGHFFLNHDPDEQDQYGGMHGAYVTGEPNDDSDLPDNEREANEFASELLIPLSMIKADWKDTHHATQLAAHYNVSEAAMWVSLLKHGIFK
jgi:Zn-dependent peptidase ImmA (M78 family)